MTKVNVIAPFDVGVNKPGNLLTKKVIKTPGILIIVFQLHEMFIYMPEKQSDITGIQIAL